jgi:protocatechuate 3,4-dioxygenase alpha subunit
MPSLLPVTPSQTVGPFFAMGLDYPAGREVAPAGHPETITLHGGVYDGAGDPVPDALLEFWSGVPPIPGSMSRDGLADTGFGRVATDDAGHYLLRALPPVRPVGGGPAHYAVVLFARGLSWHLFTRVYLPGDVAGDAGDPLLDQVPADRRSTLIAVAESEKVYRFDVRLQGVGETVFLDHG